MTRISALGGLAAWAFRKRRGGDAGSPMVTRQCPLSLHSSAAWTCWKTVRCFLGRASDWPGGESAVQVSRNGLGMAPQGAGARISRRVCRARGTLPQEFDESSDSQRTDGFDESAGVVRDDVEGLRETHQVVVALHGLPVDGVAVFVAMAMAFLVEEPGFDRPAMPRSEVAAFVHVVLMQGFAGEPCVP